MSLTELGGIITILVALITAYVSLGKLRVEDKGAIITHFKTLVDSYLQEVNRLNQELEDKEQAALEQQKQCKEEIGRLLAAHREEIAKIKAAHIEEVALLRTQSTDEILGLRRALEELRELSVKQAASIMQLREINQHGN